MSSKSKSKSSFDSKKGTFGVRKPSGALYRWGNKLMARRIQKGHGDMMGLKVLVLATVGKKSGLERTTPVGWFPGKDGSWLVVASSAGSADNPAWYYNIAANPDKVQIEVDGKKIQVTAEQLHGSEREEAWQMITTVTPRFAKYQEKTDRKIPVIRLTR